jgi:hypothetical protein
VRNTDRPSKRRTMGQPRWGWGNSEGDLFPQSRACGTAATQGRPLRGHSCYPDFDGTVRRRRSLSS